MWASLLLGLNGLLPGLADLLLCLFASGLEFLEREKLLSIRAVHDHFRPGQVEANV